MNNITILC